MKYGMKEAATPVAEDGARLLAWGPLWAADAMRWQVGVESISKRFCLTTPDICNVYQLLVAAGHTYIIGSNEIHH
jgi:hypothetical protein